MDWIDLSQDRDRLGGGFCECADEFSGSIKCREFIDWLRLASEEDTVPLSK